MGKSFIKEIRKVYGDVIWVSDVEGSIPICPILQGNIPSLDLAPSIPLILYQDLHKGIFLSYLSMISRRGDFFSELNNIIDEFALTLKYFYGLLLSRKISIVLFANVPHEGPDYVLYHLCVKLGIRTVICYQSIFENRFFMVRDMDDFSFFMKRSHGFGASVSLTPGSMPNLFYMNDALKNQSHLIARFTSYSLLPYKLVKSIAGLSGKKNKIASISKKIASISKKIIEVDAILNYKKNESSSYLKKAQLYNILSSDKNIVYFPLHLQPELTTDALGGFFRDQINALEALRSIIPSDWVIIIKENPKQGHQNRGELFFRRLRNIDNSFLVSRVEDSKALIDRAILTATITGTAGWEAILLGKVSIVFGAAWYSESPNCIRYDESLTLDKLISIINNPRPFSEVISYFSALQSSMGLGIVDPDYSNEVYGYTNELNATNLSRSIIHFINSTG